MKNKENFEKKIEGIEKNMKSLCDDMFKKLFMVRSVFYGLGEIQ